MKKISLLVVMLLSNVKTERISLQICVAFSENLSFIGLMTTENLYCNWHLKDYFSHRHHLAWLHAINCTLMAFEWH